jgi:hypothetical protein
VGFIWEGPWAGTSTKELQTYRHLPNRGSAPNPIVVGGRFVSDPERGRVWELTQDYNGVFLKEDERTSMNPQDHANKTISFWFKANEAQGRQVLYAEGHHFPDSPKAAGFNIYLDGNRLHAGSWATPKKYAAWMNYEGIQAGRWYHVTLMLKDAMPDVQPDKLHLFVDGKAVASAPGVRVPGTYGPPRLGRTRLSPTSPNETLTLFHDQKLSENTGQNLLAFRGCLAQFLLSDAVMAP